MKTPWRMWYDFRNRNWWQVDLAVLGVVIVLLALVLAGCGGQERPLPEGSGGGSAGATLGSVGAWLVWSGGISTAAGLAFRVIALLYAPLAPFGALFGFLGLGGACVVGVGSSLQWLSDNPLVMVLACAACVGVVVWWYWPRLRRALDRRLEGKV